MQGTPWVVIAGARGGPTLRVERDDGVLAVADFVWLHTRFVVGCP
jgi:hypothetical protein